MEFITGLKQQEEAELEDLLKAEEGTTIILEGADQRRRACSPWERSTAVHHPSPVSRILSIATSH